MKYYHNTGTANKQADKISLTQNLSNRNNRDRPKSSDLTDAEWAQIAPGKIIVATEDRTWLYRPRNDCERFLQPMEGAGSIATTGKLLDGAIAAARYAVDSDVRPPALTATRWIWRLAGQYHMCHPIPRLIEEAQKKFAMTRRWSLAQWAAQNACEEQGHDLLALRDIQSLGYDAEAVVKALIPPATKILIDYLTRSVQDSDPIDCVGYAYAMERLALGIDENYIQKVQTLLPKNLQATRCLRVHSSVGADADHVEEIVKVVTKLTVLERIRIARACYETALLCFSSPCDGYISDEEIQQILKPLKLHTPL